MFGKFEILFITLVILLLFYLVIKLGAGRNKKLGNSIEINKYLFGVRILITIIATVVAILWIIGFYL